MPVPKRKRSRARRDKRFANKGYAIKAIASCANCQVAIAPHQACLSCGHYKGLKVLTTKMDRALKRGKAKQAKAGRMKQAAPAATPPSDS